MAQMPRELDLLDPAKAKDFRELRDICAENVRRMQEAWRQLHNDVNWKEWVYHSVNGKRWRIGPDPDGNNFLIQELVSGDWKVQTNWITRQTIYGGPKG